MKFYLITFIMFILCSCSKSKDDAGTTTNNMTTTTGTGTGTGGTGGTGTGGGAPTPVITKIVGVHSGQFVYTAAQRFQDFETSNGMGSQLFVDSIGALACEGKFINGNLGTLTITPSGGSVQDLNFSNTLTGPPLIVNTLTASDTAGKIYWKFSKVLNFDTLVVVPCINGISGSGRIRFFSVALPTLTSANYNNYINVKGHVASAIGF